MLDRTPKPTAVHWAAFTVVARACGIVTRKPNLRKLRLAYGDVLDLVASVRNFPDEDTDSVAVIEAGAKVMLAGNIALNRHEPDAGGDRDLLAAKDLLYLGLRVRFGDGGAVKPHMRTYLPIRVRELRAEAETLVSARWAEIEAEAARIARQ